ncbi:hypothetical protein BKA56DRAFT_728201 [Ilyonectria sp. MPI-CAGE-AT-0026]|nr:hypothetical protein BKA56DRAFT_728201 [Ilyonectria sp. MPI-CAGE-AT-0026]
MTGAFRSDGFIFGSGGFEFRDSNFGGSGFGDSKFGDSGFGSSGFGGWSFSSSDPVLNSHSTFDFFGGCNPYSGLLKPEPSAYGSIPKEPKNYEYDFFASNSREGDASSGSAPPMAPTSDITFMPRRFTTQRESSNDSPGYIAPLNFKYNLDFIKQGWVTGGASGFVPEFDIQLETTPCLGKLGRFEHDHSFIFDPHADLLFSCISKKHVYKSPAENIEVGLGSFGDLPTRKSKQDAWIAFDVTGSRSSWIDIHVTRLHNHLPGENKDDCLACISSRLGLDGVGAAVDHQWNSHAKTKVGCDIGLKAGGKTCFVEHQQKIDGWGEAKAKVQHRTKSSDGRGDGWSLSTAWNCATM